MRANVIHKYGKYLIVAGIILAIIIFNQSVERVPLLSEDNTEFAKAVVLESENENLQADTEIGDSQRVTLLIKSGTYKGETVEGHSLNGYLYGADCKEGTKVIVKLSSYEGNVSASVYNYDRETEVAVLILAFLVLMWLVGGKKGANSIIALVFTVIVVIMMYVPMIYIGISPFMSAVVSVIIITVITHVLLADLEIKSIAAMLLCSGDESKK